MSHTYYQIEQLEILQLYECKLILGDVRISRIDLLCALFPQSNERIKLLERLQMTEKEELFAKFFSQAYNKGKSVDTMDFNELDAWIRELENVVFEAKATLQGASQARRERDANLKSSERDKIRSGDMSFDANDASNAINKRKERMSKRDKLEETYRNLGMSEDDIKSLLGQIKVDETKQVKPIIGALSGQVFNGTPKPIDTCPDCNLDYPAGSKHNCEKKAQPNLIDKIVENMLKPKPESVPFSNFDGLFGPKKD